MCICVPEGWIGNPSFELRPGIFSSSIMTSPSRLMWLLQGPQPVLSLDTAPKPRDLVSLETNTVSPP